MGKMIKCKHCSLEFSKKSQLIVHSHENHATYKCYFCLSCYSNFDAYVACMVKHNEGKLKLFVLIKSINLANQMYNSKAPLYWKEDATRKRKETKPSTGGVLKLEKGNQVNEEKTARMRSRQTAFH